MTYILFLYHNPCLDLAMNIPFYVFDIHVISFLANSCVRGPCKNGGACIADGADFVCRCAFGWMGETCEERE